MSPENFESRAEPRKAPQAPAFAKEYTAQLAALKDRMMGNGELGEEAIKKAEKKTIDAAFKVLNGTSNSFLLVKSEIAKTNFLNGQNSAFVTRPAYDAFVASEEGRTFLRNVIELGTSELNRQYTEGYKTQQAQFEAAKAAIEASNSSASLVEQSGMLMGNVNAKRVLQIAEQLGKKSRDVTFDDAVESGLFGIQRPSIEEIVKYGLSAMEYANPRTDRKRYNEIQRRKRKVESNKVTNVLTTPESDTLKSDKQVEAEAKMDSLNSTRKSLDGDIKKLVDSTLSTKDGDLRFYTIDGQLRNTLHADLSMASQKSPVIAVAHGRENIATITVMVKNGRTGFNLKTKSTGTVGFFDARVKSDRTMLINYVKSEIDMLELPEKQAKKASSAPKELKKSPAEGNKAQIDKDLLWIESLKESPMELTEENIQRLVKALRSTPPLDPAKPNHVGVWVSLKYGDKKGGLRIDRYKDPADFYGYVAGYKFPPAEQKAVKIAGPLDESKDKEVGSKIYRALVDSIEGREPAAEIPSEKKILINQLAKLSEKMDKRNWTKATQEELKVRFHGRDAMLTVRKEFIPNVEEMPKQERGHIVYQLGIMFAPETKIHTVRFITDRPLYEDWNELGKNLYWALEGVVDKDKKR